MKEIQSKKEVLTQEVVIPQKKQVKFLGTLKPHKGHTLFELNLESKMISVAQFIEGKIEHNLHEKELNIRKKLVVKPNCIYASALNVENAKKHFLKMLAKS